MQNYSMPLWLIIFFLSFQLVLLTIITFGIKDWIKKYFSDRILLIDKTNRWKLHYTNLYGRSTIKIAGKKYYVTESNLLNKIGRSFYVFAENKPTPMKIEYNKAKWFNAESLRDFMNNKLAQQIVKPTDKIIDILIMVGAVGSIIAGLASLINLLITTGIIKNVVP